MSHWVYPTPQDFRVSQPCWTSPPYQATRVLGRDGYPDRRGGDPEWGVLRPRARFRRGDQAVICGRVAPVLLGLVWRDAGACRLQGAPRGRCNIAHIAVRIRSGACRSGSADVDRRLRVPVRPLGTVATAAGSRGDRRQRGRDIARAPWRVGSRDGVSHRGNVGCDASGHRAGGGQSRLAVRPGVDGFRGLAYVAGRDIGRHAYGAA